MGRKINSGDLVRYKHCRNTLNSKGDSLSNTTALVVYVNEAGGTLGVLDNGGIIDWYVTSQCEIIDGP